MKIKIKKPDWVPEDRNLYLFAGTELVAKKRPGKSWELKEKSCNYCGKCCTNKPEDWKHGTKNGNCKHLTYRANEYICDLGMERPFSCCVDDDSDKNYCCIEWR